MPAVRTELLLVNPRLVNRMVRVLAPSGALFAFFLLELVPNPIRSIDYWTGRCQDNEDNYCYCCQRSWVIAVGRGCSKMQARTKNYSSEGDSSTEVIIFYSTKK